MYNCITCVLIDIPNKQVALPHPVLIHFISMKIITLNTLETKFKKLFMFGLLALWKQKNILTNSKPKLSAGFDEIPLKLLKFSPDNIIIALSHIFNLSLSTGKVISDFKIAKIIPLCKKGDANDINNYRHIIAYFQICPKF